MLGGKARGDARDRGAVLVEAALITPLLVMLLFGIWTTARAWNIHNVLDHAAREAARYGAVDPTHASIQTVAQGEVVAASFPWSSVVRCTAIFDNGAWTTSRPPAPPVTPGVPCLGAGTGPGQDPTTDDRIQVSLRVPSYQLNFVVFTTTVDLEARAVARLEP